MHQAIVIDSQTPQKTEQIAHAFALALVGGETVLLEGDLGAGKTFFVRAAARALGVREHVTSPTFVLQKSYSVPGKHVHAIVHYDLYRIGSYAELIEIGFEDLAEDAVAMVEWGDRFLGEYAGRVVRVRLHYVGEESRRMEFLFPDQQSQAGLVSELRALDIPFTEGNISS